MKKPLLLILKYPAGILLYILAAVLAWHGGSVPSMLIFLALMMLEISVSYRESSHVLDLRLLLSLSWLLGISISVLKLSELQTDWSKAMWISCGGFYFLYLAGFDLVSLLIRRKHTAPPETVKDNELNRDDPLLRKAILSAVTILTAVAFAAFLAECVILRFHIPFFLEWSYAAYSEFHVTGVHYFVVALVLVPPISMYYCFLGRPDKKERRILIGCNAFAFLVPFLILSKMQMLLSLALPVMVFLVIQERISRRKILIGSIGFVILVAILFFVLMLLKNYPDGYLKGLFRFKNPDTPMAIQYPYVYIVNNYENLNLLTINLKQYSYGIRELFPVFALTGMKFLPGLQPVLAVEQYTTIEELTTLTILYHVYGDFGIPGTFVFGIVLGGISALITDRSYRRKSLGGVLLYTQMAFYMALAFFTTWFSDATTWFYFIATGAITVYIHFFRKWKIGTRRTKTQ